MILLLLGLLANSMHNARQEGRTLGSAEKERALSEAKYFQADELAPKKANIAFDPTTAEEEAKRCAKNRDYIPKSQLLEYLRSQEVQHNRSQVEEEYFLERSEKNAQQADLKNLEVEEALEKTTESCQQADAPYPLSVIRDLQVEVVYDPGEVKEIKICNRHSYEKKFHNKKDAENKVKELRQSLSQDRTIKWYSVSDPKGGSLFHRYHVEANWEHNKDAQTCDSYKTQLKNLRPPSYDEVGDTWLYEDKDLVALSKTPDCTLFHSDCLDSTPSKWINGKEVKRPCWKEKLTFLCSLPQPTECHFIKNKNCELIKKDCLTMAPYGCALWQLTFTCYSKRVKKNLGVGEYHGLDEKHDYPLNDSFSEVAAKLAVFDAIKKELETTQAPDARSVQIFTGKKMQCSKSISERAMYDCCFSYSGLAKQLGLSHCHADEIALAEMRENGLCHYVGSYDGEFLDLWKSRDEHVFCCFGSKLARILHQNGRQQLGIEWGKPKHADCRGLTLDEVARLDFTIMDFSELYSGYEKKLPENFSSRLEALESKIKKKVEEHG